MSFRSMMAAVAGCLASCIALAGPASAETYPTRPVTMIVPYAAGGATDVVARAVAEKLTGAWGQAVVVDNRAGAGTTIAARTVAQAPGDGYLLYMTTSAHTISGHLYPGLTFDALKDFAPITLITKVPLVLVVSPQVPASNMAEFLAWLAKEGDKVNYASPGIGTAQHLSGELFKIATKSGITHVPYKGDAPALTDLMGGQVQMMLATATAVIPLIESGKVKAIAVAHNRRLGALPQVPTFAEAGVKDFEAATWFGLLAPAKIKPELVEKIYADVSKIVAEPDMRRRIEQLGGDVVNSTPAEFATFMKEESGKWAAAVKASGASLK
ncbi:tripartite tricarboxylate transporter substrate binding protein [Xanthobacter sp. 91]|uniref:tripartite tricarboxylate transporter substrate binding protein n=1 Tax=Xanthobacter sp. 91 TaxID=1117244 RepID=UPI00068B6CFF|nr:tripartite tricarboxylate transporter substrate binding protein [Xanthobacter sp. 91]